MNARVQCELCSGCGVCEVLCPEVFEMGGETARAKSPRVPADAEGFCLEAAWTCPQRAIMLKNLECGVAEEWRSWHECEEAVAARAG